MAGSRYIRNYARKHYFLTLALLIFALSSKSIYHYNVEKNGLSANVLDNFPTQINEWSMFEESSLDPTVTDTLNVDEYLNRIYSDGEHSVHLYLGYYHTHKKHVEIHTPENCQRNSGWELVSKKEKSVTHGHGENQGTIHFIEAIYNKNGKRYMMAYFYKLMNETTTNFFSYKLMVIRNSIVSNRSDAAFIRIMLPVEEKGIDRSARVSEEFLQALSPVLFRTLP